MFLKFLVARFFFFQILTFSSMAMAAAPVGQSVSPSGLPSLMTYEATVAVPPGMPMTPANVRHLVDLQSKHLMGEFEQAEYAKFIGVQPNDDFGVIGWGPIVKLRVLKRSADGTQISYQATNRVLVWKRILQPGQTRDIKIILPVDPVNYYSRACTDKKWYEKEYEFYYFNPFDPACAATLKGKNSVITVPAKLLGLQQPPVSTRPDYQSLAAQVKARGELHISLLFGFDLTSRNPRDEGRVSYNYFMKEFANDGFAADRRRNIPSGPYAELIRQGDASRPTVHVSMSLSASDINSPVTFARRAREAFETSDIVMYVGHSGLGGNLDLNMITRLSSADPNHPTPIRFPNAYQIYFLDSCGSYYFYLNEYLGAVHGPHVDVVTNGLSAAFMTQNIETWNFLDFFIDPKGPAGWIDILTAVELPAHGFTYLVNVTPVR